MTFSRFLRLWTAVVLAALFAGCAAAPTAPAKPKLVVLLVVDGLPQRQVLALRDQLAPDGFARFLDRGAWFANAHCDHAFTVTAAGHAAILTGAYPHRTGIIGNEWRDSTTGAHMYNTGDPQASYIGHKTDAGDGTSPKNLKVETLGDVLRRIEPRSKVIAISGKDRGAILPAGKLGTAYMYMDDTGLFASSSYYMKQHPAWVDAFNSKRPADRYFKTEWTALLAEPAYARSIPDSQPWFGPMGGKLPMMMGVAADDAPGPAFYRALLASPFVDALTLEFARAAIAGEQLGRDDAPDILSVSLSGHDFVNHRWSAESRLSHDHLLQLDRQLEGLFRDLDATVGKDNYIAVLTADHGFMPATEFSRSQGLEVGRINFSQVVARLNAGLTQRFGAGRWVLGNSASSLLLDRQLIASRQLDLDSVAQEARRLLLAEPGFMAAYTRRELLTGSQAGQPFFNALRRSWHPDVSGDVQYTIKPNWMFGSAVATHGSPHPYDTHVPILLYAPGWVKPGRIDARVEVVDIAPTLARLLRVPAPSASEGRP
ncbi:MAG TPA: alkaline phosphatase family protein, partial [Ramlibacter sp.]|nr:alkaline phosphatase family protein [Ramlibacter sp.]